MSDVENKASDKNAEATEENGNVQNEAKNLVKADAEPAAKTKADPSEKIEVEPAEAAKTDETKETPPTSLECRIIQQIEYYFGDANLSRDKFLLGEIAKDDGWVPLTVLLTFKRLASITTDALVIAAALKKSDECLIEISEDQTKIRRHPDRPLAEQNEATRKETIARTAYVKGFPLTVIMSELIDFFMPFEKVTNVVMRKYLDKPTKTYKFKGSVFVSFAKKEQCGEFLQKEKVCYGETELIRKWQSEYYESKKEERQNEKAKNERLRNNKSDKDSFTIDLPKGAVIHLDGLDEDISREQIKAVIVEMGGEVAYIDYKKGDKSGHVRLSVENSAKPIVDKLEDSKLKVGECAATARVIDGEEETEFLATVVMNMKSRRNQAQHHHHRQKGGRYQNRKRRNSQTGDGEPPVKQTADE